jgi:hypothetical protein
LHEAKDQVWIKVKIKKIIIDSEVLAHLTMIRPRKGGQATKSAEKGVAFSTSGTANMRHNNNTAEYHWWNPKSIQTRPGQARPGKKSHEIEVIRHLNFKGLVKCLKEY